jgi:hypothetical protein
MSANPLIVKRYSLFGRGDLDRVLTIHDSRITNNERVHRWVIVCYTLELLALSIWIGGLVIIVAAVIPAVFNSFGMEPGGRFLTRVFEGYNRLVLVSAGMLIIGAVSRTMLSRAAAIILVGLSRIERTVAITMIVLAVVLIFVLEPSSVRLQEHAFTIKDEAERKAAYESFFKTHTIVRALYVVNLGFAIALVPLKVRSLIAVGRSNSVSE